MRTSFSLPCLPLSVLIFSALAETALAGPKNTTILLIRHAEKSLNTKELTLAGEARAKGYESYFQDYQRTRATVEPVAAALGLKVDTSFENKAYASMATELETRHAGEDALICWHHGYIPVLLQALGAEPATIVCPP